MFVAHLQTETSDPSGCVRPIYSTTQADLSERPMSGFLYFFFDYGFKFNPFHSSKKKCNHLSFHSAKHTCFYLESRWALSARFGSQEKHTCDGLMGCIDHLQLIIPCSVHRERWSRFLTSFLISASTPWALIHESWIIFIWSTPLWFLWPYMECRDPEMNSGILMFDANLSRWFHW